MPTRFPSAAPTVALALAAVQPQPIVGASATGKAPVSVTVLTRNEERKIEAALASVAWAAEIVLIDSGSTDRTAEIALRHGARIVQVPFRTFGALREASVVAAAQPWIFSLDADERCTPEARDEILRVIADPRSADAYLVPRRNNLLGREIRHGGWYPDYRQPQLFRRSAIRYRVEDEVHEGWDLAPGTRLGKLRHPIRQIPYASVSEALAKLDRYTTLGVAREQRRGRRHGYAGAFARALWAFAKAYVFQRGFLDGGPGLVIALLRFENSFYKHVKVCEAGLPQALG